MLNLVDFYSDFSHSLSVLADGKTFHFTFLSNPGIAMLENVKIIRFTVVVKMF